MNRKTKYILIGIGLLIPIIVLLIYGYANPASLDAMREYVDGFGMWAPVVFLIIQVLQVVLAPISGYVTGIIGGLMFGLWYGALLNYIGTIIGHVIAFYLAKKIGRPIVEKIVKRETLEKYDRFWDKGGVFLLFIIYYLPLFPDDEISYIVGASKMRFIPFLMANVLGRTGGALALAYIGSGIKIDLTFFLLLFFLGIFALIFSIIWYKKYYPRFK